MTSSTNRLLLIVLLFAGIAGGLLAWLPAARTEGAALQRRMGGLGGGAAVHPSRCGFAFDGRVHPFCSWRHGAVLGADRYCPLHGPAAARR